MQKISFLIILILVGCIGFLKFCSVPAPSSAKTITKTITIPGDKIPYAVPVKVPVPFRVEIHDTIPVLNKVDTAEILERYFARLIYRDTISDDTSFRVVIQEIISQNKIVNRELWNQNLRVRQVLYQTVINGQSGWYIGSHASFGGNFGFGVGGLYLKNKYAIGGNVDILNRNIGLLFYCKF